MLLLLATAPPVAGLLGLLIGLVICLALIGLIFWATNKLSAAFGIPEPIKSVIVVVLVIVIVVALIYFLWLGGSWPR